MLNEIRQTIYSLYQEKEVTKKVYNKNIKTSNPHRLLPNLTDKTNLKECDIYVALSNLSILYPYKNIHKNIRK